MTTLAEKATEVLRWEILLGKLRDGEELTERALCERLNMSRTPIRIALQTLANEGLLSYEPQRRHRIRYGSPNLISDAYEVRAVLEGMACRLLAERGCPPAVEAELRACLDLGRSLLGQGEKSFQHAQWRSMNQRFHNAILDAVGNASLTSAVRNAERVPMSTLSVIATIGSSPNFALLEGAQRDHERIHAALVAAQPQRVEALMREHIYVARDLILAQLSRQMAAG